MTESSFFQDLAMLMTVAGMVAVVFSRLGWPKVLGYLGAGILMSSYTWGGAFLEDITTTRTIGQLGIVFLMFSMGLSFSPREMRRIKSVAVPAAVIDTVVMIWIGYTVGTRAFGWSPVMSLFLGVAICDSATTLLAKVIDELGWSNRSFAHYVLGTSVCEDIICVGAIAVATGFAKGGGMSAGAFAASLGGLFVFFMAVIVFGFILVPRLLQSVGSRKDDEALVLAVLGACFFISYFAYRFDYSLALGAFLVGILCGTSICRERIARLIDPLKSMFAAVFFVSIGLLVDPAALWQYLPAILLVTLLVVLGKTLNNFLASILCGLEVKVAVQNALALAQIGEFAFMVAILYAGLAHNSTEALFPIAIGVSLLTTLLNPALIRLSEPVGDFIVRIEPERVQKWHAAYRAWLTKIGASEDKPAFKSMRLAAIRLGVYAILAIAVAAACTLVPTYDFSRFSVLFERYDDILFFMAANIFIVAELPLIVSASRMFADAVADLLSGEGDTSRWRSSLHLLVRSFVRVGVLAAFFMEWSMLNVATAPREYGFRWVSLALIVIVGVVGWKFFRRAGRRATRRFTEALTAEERQAGLARTMTVMLPEGTIHRFTLDATSPAIGGTVVTLNIRAKTGASIVSVVRAGTTTRNIGPEWEFAVGDTLTALGDQSQIAALKDLLGITG